MIQKKWYSVLFLILIYQVFAIDGNCFDSCDECLRCNRHWCNDPNEEKRCVASHELNDNWCNGMRETIPSISDKRAQGKHFVDKYWEKTVFGGDGNILTDEVTYLSKTPKKEHIVVNSTQADVDTPITTTECNNGRCIISIQTELNPNFCAKDAKIYEYFTIKLTLEGIDDEEAIMKNHVPCACQCSQVVDLRSQMCHGRGNYSCGSCACEAEWTGKSCERCAKVEQKSKMCSEHGTYSCGNCTCEEGWTGKSCEHCDKEYDARMNYKCQGRGTYLCGKCVCEGQWSGKSCEQCTVVEQRSQKCHGRGDYSCGKCTCEEGWTGKSCEEVDKEYEKHMDEVKCKGRGTYRFGKCDCEGQWTGQFCEECSYRGDINCNSKHGECSGHGRCGCGCECYKDTVGSRYFDPEKECEDLCMTISDNCDMCAFNSTPGRCNDCKYPLFRQPYDESVMDDRDDLNRHLWVKCNDTYNNCTAEYAAMRNDAGVISIMLITSCDPYAAPMVDQGNVALPVTLGVLLLLLMALAAVGYLFWKNRMAGDVDRTHKPSYHNIDTEVEGMNPIYKDPTTSFNNPTYKNKQ